MAEETDYDVNFFKLPHIPLPDDLPQNRTPQLPQDIIKSTAVENLIAQNEDLMARLKVSLRRLSILEIENQKIISESQKIKQTFSALSDQMLVLKEKDHIWKQKTDQAENAVLGLTEKLEIYQNEVQRLQQDLDRHKKYQDKIKTQVKPYIQELKDKLNEQNIDLQEKEQKISQLENLVKNLREQILFITQNAKKQIEIYENYKIELTQFYDSQIESLNKELQQLRPLPEQLEHKTVLLNKALERQDSLENEVVALHRSKDDLREQLQAEINRVTSVLQDTTKQNKKLGVEHADLQIKVLEDQKNIDELKGKNSNLQEQLDSLRYMWSAKNEENEKLKSSLAALEHLNVELSQKLNLLRTKVD